MKISITKKIFFLTIIMCISLFLHIEASEIAQVEEQLVHISPKKVNSSINDMAIIGEIPQVRFIKFDPLVENIINTEIEDKFNEKIELAKQGSIKAVYFEYQIIQEGAVYSLILKTTMTSQGADRSDVDSVNFDTSTKQIIHINDILGPNGAKILTKYIKDEIGKEPDKYRSDFTGITNEHDFYLSKDKIYILFDKNEIALGSEGVISFNFNISGITNYTINVNVYKVKTDSYRLKMIPLRSVAEAFGYTIAWYGTTQTIDIKRQSILSSIKIGENNYFVNTTSKRPLEAAPELINGTTYVPVSFFEEFLTLDYFVNDDGTITFSEYKQIKDA